MATSDITSCPSEVLEHVFGFLPLSDRKSASVVSRLWSELAFSRRNLRNVVLRVEPNFYECLSDKYDVLKRSSRAYQHVALFNIESLFSQHDFNIVVTILELFGLTLESVHFWNHITTRQLRQAVLVAPNLKHLFVALLDSTVNDGEELPVLRSLTKLGLRNNCLQIRGLNLWAMAPNVQNLSVNFTECEDPVRSLQVLQQFAPELHVLDLSSNRYFFPIHALKFPKLKILRLSGDIVNPNEVEQDKFLSQFSDLKEVTFDCGVDESVLNAFASSCSALRKLCFKTELMGTKSFIFLKNLKQLEVLNLNGAIRPEMLKDCTPLQSIIKLHLKIHDFNECELVFKHLSTILPNLLELKISIVRQLCLEDLRSLCQHFTHLKRLSLTDCANIEGDSRSLLAALDQLLELEELSLDGFIFPVTSLAASGSLRRLKFKDVDDFSDDNSMIVLQKYPQLRYFEVSGCLEFTAEGARMLRVHMPNCVVHYLPTPEMD